MQKISALFDRFWLPLFLVLSLSWLVAPAMHHVQQYGALAVISHYEAVDQPFAWLFRLCDILAAIILALGVWRFKIWQQERPVALLLYAIALFAAIDGLFPLGCLGTCTEPDRLSGLIHDAESILATIALLTVTIIVIRRRPHWISAGFLGLQLICGGIVLSDIVSHAWLVVIQFVYEVVLLAWLGWLVTQFSASPPLSERVQTIVRKTTGALTLVSGIVAIVLAIPHRTDEAGFLPHLVHQVNQPWLVQHGIVVGVLLLYLSHHISKGQRRAATLLGIVMVTQVVRYAIFQPHPLLLLTSLVLAIALWWGRGAFNRNVGPAPITSRLQDAARVLAGGLIAAGLILAIAITTHHQQRLYHALGQSSHLRHRVPDKYGRPLSLAFNTLGVSLLVMLLWSLFRPSGASSPTSDSDQAQAESLLRRYSNSSEDYFKLWPADKSYYFNQQGSGFVAYKTAGSIAFALADPIAPEPQRAGLVAEFTEYCRRHGWTACFILVQEPSKPLYEKLKIAQIGSSAIIDVKVFSETTQREKWWRWQYNRAKKAGFVYETAAPPHNAGLLAEMHTVSKTWLQRAGHSEQGFALGYFDSEYLQHCMIHLLRDNTGRLIAFSNELPRYGTVTQKTVDLIRFLPDIDGAMPVLIMHIVNHLHQAGSSLTFDLGFVPLAKVESPLASLARRLTQSRFSAAGLEQFKGKFRPDWQPNYVAYDGGFVDFALLVANLENALKVETDEPASASATKVVKK